MNYVLKNLKLFAKENTVIFILFILCEFAAALILFFSFGTYQNFKLIKNNDINKSDIIVGFGNVIDEYAYENEIYYECDGSVNNADIKKVLSLLSPQTLSELDAITYTASTYDYTGAEEFYGLPLEICFRLEYSEKEKMFIPFDVAFNNSPTLFGEGLSFDDYNNGEKKIVLPYYYSSEFVGQNIEINGESYEVLGVDSIDDYAVIPFVDSPDSLSDVSKVYFLTNNVISQKSYDDLVGTLKKVFGDYVFIPKVDTIDTNLPFYNSIMFLSVALACLAAITLALLFKYVLSTRNRFISVLRVCGCTNFKVRQIFILEILITSIFSFLLAAIIYFGALTDRIKTALVYIDIVYSFRNIAIISGIYLICIYVVLNIMIIIKLLKSPVTQMKQGGY